MEATIHARLPMYAERNQPLFKITPYVNVPDAFFTLKVIDRDTEGSSLGEMTTFLDFHQIIELRETIDHFLSTQSPMVKS